MICEAASIVSHSGIKINTLFSDIHSCSVSLTDASDRYVVVDPYSVYHCDTFAK